MVNMEDLPEEILQNIFGRLPSETISALEPQKLGPKVAVSKLKQIPSKVSEKHDLRTAKPAFLVTLGDRHKVRKAVVCDSKGNIFQDTMLKEDVEIIAVSSNGMYWIKTAEEGGSNMLVCCPTAGSVIRVPSPPQSPKKEQRMPVSSSLGFDTEKGIWYLLIINLEPQSPRLRFWYSGQNNRNAIKIGFYSSELNSWRSHEIGNEDFGKVDTPLYWRGRFFFVCKMSSTSRLGIGSFNVTESTFSTIELPPSSHSLCEMKEWRLCGGHDDLWIVNLCDGMPPSCWRLVMVEDEEGEMETKWVEDKKHVVFGVLKDYHFGQVWFQKCNFAMFGSGVAITGNWHGSDDILRVYNSEKEIVNNITRKQLHGEFHDYPIAYHCWPLGV